MRKMTSFGLRAAPMKTAEEDLESYCNVAAEFWRLHLQCH